MRRSALSIVLLVGFVLGSPLAASAITYQVGPSRSYRQISEVAGLLNPGDIVEVDGNATYSPVTFDRPGTAAQPITIRGHRVSGRRPTLSGSDSSGFTLYMRTRTQQMGYYTVEGFEITGGSQACIRNQARNVTYRDIKVYNCTRHGLLSHDYNSGSLTVSHAEFTGIGGTFAGENLKHAVYITSDQQTNPGSTCRVEYSYIHDNVTGNNIKSRCERNEFYYNWIEGAPVYEIELIGPEDTGAGLRGDSDIVGNVLLGYHGYLVRMGTDSTGQETRGRYRFLNNTMISLNANGAGITRHMGSISSIEFINNIIYAQGTSLRLHRVDGTWENGTEIITGRNNWISSNMSTGLSGGAGGALLASSMRGTEPGFANPTGTNTFDPRLTVGSVAINAGTTSTTGSNQYPIPNPLVTAQRHPPYRLSNEFNTVTPIVRAVVGSIDLGAFEFGSGGLPTPAPPTNLRIVTQ